MHRAGLRGPLNDPNDKPRFRASRDARPWMRFEKTPCSWTTSVTRVGLLVVDYSPAHHAQPERRRGKCSSFRATRKGMFLMVSCECSDLL